MVQAVPGAAPEAPIGRQPEVVDLFCGEGGVSEGIRRAGMAATGVDMYDKPRYYSPNRNGLWMTSEP